MEKQTVTRYAVMPAVLSAFCVMFHYGFFVGTFNSLSVHMKQFYNESYTMQFGTPLDDETGGFLWALTAAVFPLGGIVGSFLSKPLVAKYGRRKTILYNQFVIVAALILMGFAKAMNSFENILLGRTLAGVFAAVGMGVAPMYVTEITAHQIRGAVGGFFSTSVAFGSLVAHILGLEKLLGTTERWPFTFAVAMLPVVAQVCYAPWMPKSPRALYIDKKDPANAAEVLIRLRGGNDIKVEMDDLRRESVSSTKLKIMTVYQLITTRSLRWQLLSSLVIMSTLQLTGINGIQFYLNDIFIAAGIDANKVIYCSIGVITIQLFTALGGGFLAERTGRRVLLLFGNFTIAIALLVLTVALAFSVEISWMCYLCVGAVLVFIIGSSIGPCAVSYSVTPELFSQVARPAAMMLGTFVLWLSFAMVAFVTPYFFNLLQFAAFTPFFLIAVATTLFLYFVLPETKGQTFTKIQALFAERNKVVVDNNRNEIMPLHFVSSNSSTSCRCCPVTSRFSEATDSKTDLSAIEDGRC